MASKRGETVYKIYRALTQGISPLIRLHLQWRRFRRREHPLRWRERLGFPSAPRPTGHLIWFHAVSLGEGLAAIPVIKCCLERRPDVTVLMTTTTTSAFEVIKNRLPSNVIYQIAMTLLNGRMSTKSFQNWSHPLFLPLISLMLSKFSLILPLSTIQGIRFQLLQASPVIINYSGDLKYAVADFCVSEGKKKGLKEFEAQLSGRKVWMASSIHKGEEEVFIGAHDMLKRNHADVVTIIVPRQPQHGEDIAQKLQEEGISVALRSRGDNLTPETSIYVVDSLGELREFYRLTPIAVIGGSFAVGSAGHNISEAAAAGCAVLTGNHVGHFSHMVAEMQRVNPLSVLQVSGEKLAEAVNELFGNVEIFEARRLAARQAYHALSSGIVENIWEMLQFHVFEKLNAKE
ncbi:hypothetical protein ABFX02_10G049500 [Erythranthe guttata]